MASKVSLRGSRKARLVVNRTRAGTSEQCTLSLVGILVGLVAIIYGVMAMRQVPATATLEDATNYWMVAVWGIWVPGIAIMGSIVGVIGGLRFALPVLWASPILSISGYVFYNFPQVQHYFEVLSDKSF